MWGDFVFSNGNWDPKGMGHSNGWLSVKNRAELKGTN